MKKLIFIIVFFFAINLNAQVSDYNSKTLALFNEGNWKGLIELAQEAQQLNSSNYEIDYRLAVAYYNLANYFDSANQFSKLKKNYEVNYDIINEYLYYSYLFSGNETEALLIAKDFPFHLKQKINPKEPTFFDFVYTEGGVKVSDRRNIDVKNLSYFNVGLGHNLGAAFKVYHAFSTLSQEYIGFDYKQTEYYINANAQIGEGLTLIPAYHYINIADQNPQYQTIQVPGGGNRWVTVRVNNKDQKLHVFHLGLKKQWIRFSLMPNITSSTTDGIDENGISKKTTQFQYGIDLGYSLKVFNDKIWLGFGGYMHNDENENNFIWNVKTYFQITPKVYLLTKYNQSNISNFSEDNALVFVNAISKSKDKISSTLGTSLSKNLKMYVNYQLENLENIDKNTAANNFKFTYNTFIFGLKLNL